MAWNYCICIHAECTQYRTSTTAIVYLYIIIQFNIEFMDIYIGIFTRVINLSDLSHNNSRPMWVLSQFTFYIDNTKYVPTVFSIGSNRPIDWFWSGVFPHWPQCEACDNFKHWQKGDACLIVLSLSTYLTRLHSHWYETLYNYYNIAVGRVDITYTCNIRILNRGDLTTYVNTCATRREISVRSI